MNTRIQTQWNANEQKALKLLGSGYSASTVATAVGVTEGRISQLMSDPQFASEVTELRFHNLQKHNDMDDQYDQMEKAVAKNLKEAIPLMMRPSDLLMAARTLNNMKRRGQSAPDQVTHQNTVVTLLMPTTIVQKFTTNVNNQVIHAGNQTLETIQGSALLSEAKNKQDGLHNEPANYTAVKELSN